MKEPSSHTPSSRLDMSKPDDNLRWAIAALHLVENKLKATGCADDMTELHNLRTAIASIEEARKLSAPSETVAPVSSIDYQQRRGMLADTVDWAVLEYDGYMKDDAYDAQAVLDKIANRLREVRDMLNGR